MTNNSRGKCSVYWTSRVGVFFLKKVSSREDCAEDLVIMYYEVRRILMVSSSRWLL